MLIAAKTALHNLATHPEIQALLWLALMDLTIRGTSTVYETLMNKAARHIAAEIRRIDSSK
jgi:hypothetical protein